MEELASNPPKSVLNPEDSLASIAGEREIRASGWDSFCPFYFFLGYLSL